MISIKNLTKEFSGQKVLDGIDIDIEKGEVVALVGASGAGKSTILRSLNYLEQPDSGTITIDDFKVDFETTIAEDKMKLEYLPKFYKEKYPNWNDLDIERKIANLTDNDMDDMIEPSFYDNNLENKEKYLRLILNRYYN